MNSERKNPKKNVMRARWLVGSLLTLLLITAALAPGVAAAQPPVCDMPNDGIVTSSEDQAICCGCQAPDSTSGIESDLLGTSPPSTYTYGDIPLDETTYQMYLKRLDAGLLDALDALPTAYDARNDAIVTPPKNQGSCGDCWAFAAAGAMESHLLDAGLSFNPTDLSEQQQNSCNLDMSGCCGGSMDSLHFWETRGPVYDPCFPYGEGGTSCPTQRTVPCSNGDSCPQLPYRVTNFYTVASDQFRQSLYDDGPSYWRFDVYQDFEDWYWDASTPAGDVYVNADTAAGNTKKGGHAVLIIGWDDAKGAYLMKNSWGDTSGPQGDGTFWIAYSGHHNDLGFAMANFDVLSLDVDMSIAKSDNPDPVIAGEQLIYDITVANVGSNIATNVVVTDVLPSAVTYLVSTGSCVEGPIGTLTCTRAAMDPGESWSFQIVVKVKEDAALPIGTSVLENTASVTADGTDPNPADNTAIAYTIVNENADLKIIKDIKPDGTLQAGDEAECTIIIENLGPSTARNVTLIDEYLSDGTFEFGTITPGSCTSTPNPQFGHGTVTGDFGDLAVGGRVTVRVRFSADQPQDINNHASVSGLTPDPDHSNNQADDSVSVVGVCDLRITKTDLPDPVVAGAGLNYTLAVTNIGPSTATGVVVRDWLPADVVIDNLNPSVGSVIAGEPGDVSDPMIWNVGNMAAGGTEAMTVHVTVLPQTVEGTLLQNDADVSSAGFDPVNANNVVNVNTTVISRADLVITKTDLPDPVVAGEQLTYKVSITNNGPSTARNVSLTEELPAEVTFVDASISDGGTLEVLEVPPLTVECRLNDLDPGELVLVYVKVLVDPSVLDGSLISNTAMVSSSTEDPNETNNIATQDTTIKAVADLMIEKDVNFETGSASTTIIYFIKITNVGPSDGQNVSVVDYLPSVTTKGGQQKVEFVFATEGCQYDAVTHTVRYSHGILAAGDAVELEIHIQVSGSPGVITNTAEVSSDTYDPDTTNNTAIKDVTVKGGTNKPGGPGGGRGKGPNK
jgi:uncharacterized repeat protein (TIGR01451 family)